MEIRGRWTPFEASGVYRAAPLSFSWRARLRMLPGVWIVGEDGHRAGEGWGSARLWGTIPIGIPMLAGPGTISTVVIVSGITNSVPHKLLVSGVIVSVGAIVYSGCRLWLMIGPRLGTTTLHVMKTVMGLILAAIAAEFILDGIGAHSPTIPPIR